MEGPAWGGGERERERAIAGRGTSRTPSLTSGSVEAERSGTYGALGARGNVSLRGTTSWKRNALRSSGAARQRNCLGKLENREDRERSAIADDLSGGGTTEPAGCLEFRHLRRAEPSPRGHNKHRSRDLTIEIRIPPFRSPLPGKMKA